MKMGYNLPIKKVLMTGFLLMSLISSAQHFTVTLANFTSTANTFEVEIVLIIDAPIQGVKLSSLATGIYYNPAILNGGTPCTTQNCGSWAYIPGTRNPLLSSLNEPSMLNRANPVGHLRFVQIPAPASSNLPGVAVDLLPGTYSFGKYRFTNTVPWTADSDAQLWLSNSNAGGSSNTIVNFYPYGANSPMAAYTTILPAASTGLTLGYTESTPMSRILNSSLATPENSINPLQVIPNPFSTTFEVDFETISNEQVSVKVYDMLGKVIDNQVVEANEISSLQIGENYQSGIYNVMVSQGEKIQNVRVIKR